MIILHKVVANAGFRKRFGAIRFHEETSWIFMNLGLNYDDSGKRGLDYVHFGLVRIREREQWDSLSVIPSEPRLRSEGSGRADSRQRVKGTHPYSNWPTTRESVMSWVT